MFDQVAQRRGANPVERCHRVVSSRGSIARSIVRHDLAVGRSDPKESFERVIRAIDSPASPISAARAGLLARL
jgi:hypothetical protein